MLKLRGAGQDVEFDSVQSLQSELEENHRGKHLSIIYQKPRTRIYGCVFVSVDDVGGCFESYGQNLPIDFHKIEAELSA